jgi:hypothetical protein
MFHYIILPFHSLPTIPSSITSPLIVVTILMLDGPLVWPPDHFYVPITFHSIPTIPLLFYYLLYTLLIVVAICCQMVRFFGIYIMSEFSLHFIQYLPSLFHSITSCMHL